MMPALGQTIWDQGTFVLRWQASQLHIFSSFIASHSDGHRDSWYIEQGYWSNTSSTAYSSRSHRRTYSTTKIWSVESLPTLMLARTQTMWISLAFKLNYKSNKNIHTGCLNIVSCLNGDKYPGQVGRNLKNSLSQEKDPEQALHKLNFRLIGQEIWWCESIRFAV